MTLELLATIVGGIAGFPLGRWTAEVGHTRYDMRRVWQGRRNYRGG
jgi:hypothetical protein